jgi:hypothetical protein
MSADAQFKQFVARQRRPAPVDNALDWNKERDDWLAYLQHLYESIAEYLDEYIKDGAIELRESDIELNEENIGVYTAKRLAIVIGAQEILLTPVGTLLIGSKGRVDVKGSAGDSRLVLINKKITNPRQMVRVTVTIIPPGGSPPPPPPPEPPSPEKIEWAWKIVSRPPAMQFTELNKDTLFEMLMEVSNG